MIKKRFFSIKDANIRKTLRIMRLIICFLLLGINLSYAVESYSQTTRISVNLKNTPLKEIFSEIEKNTEYVFFYYDESVDLNKSMTIDMKGQTIDKVLKELFKSTDYIYTVSDRQVFVSRKPASATTQQNQNKITIRGNVTDMKGEPLIGVSIIVKSNPSTGTVTDTDGNYSINVADKYTVLQYKYIGFLPKDETVGERKIINVIMQEDVGQLDEVVVVGYSTQKKESVVGSISTIEPGKLAAGTTRSMSNNLAGQLAGVIGVQRSGEPGYDNSNFWIRGISTFQGNRTPLVLIDGIERSLNNIDPEEIESFSVLKDASASAVYGVRGANGVILINTKRGRVGKPTVSFKMEQAITQPTKIPEFVGAADYLEVMNSIRHESGKEPMYSQQHIDNIRNGVDPDLYPSVDWMDAILRDYGTNTRASIDINGGSEVLRYSFVGAFYHEGGILERDKNQGWNYSLRLNRNNMRSNVDINLTPTTLVRFNIGGYMQERTSPPQSIDNLFAMAYQTPPYQHPTRYSTGEIPQVPQRVNPWALLTQTGYERIVQSKIESLFVVEQDLKMFLPGLKIKGTFSFDNYSDNSVKRGKSPDYYNPATGRDPETGQLELVVSSYGQEFLDHSVGANFGNKNTYLEGTLTYDNTFGDHTVNALFLYNQRNYDDGGKLPFRFQGIAGRLSYTMKGRYIGEFNFGYNGSENFAKGKRYGFFPSVAAGWILSEEPFMQGVRNTLSKVKFRGSWGLVGNDRFKIGDTEYRFPYISTINNTDGYVWGYNRDEFGRAGRWEGNIANTGLKWETVAKTNLGLELGLFNAIELQVDYFMEKRRDIFMRRTTMPASAGFVDMPFANFGKVDNKGVDMVLDVNKQINKDWFVSARGTFTYAKNKIIEQDESLGIIGTNRSSTGLPVGQIFGLVAERLFTDDDFADVENGILKDDIPTPTFTSSVRPGDIKYVDVNGDNRIDALDRTNLGGTVDPQIVYGFGANLRYKNIDFGFFFQGNGHTYRMIGREAYFIPGSGLGGVGNFFTNVGDRWTIENPRQDVFYPRLYEGLNENNYQESTWWMKNMKMLRLKNIELGYNFPVKMVRKFGSSGARIFCRGTNILTISDFKLWDPEIDSDRGSKYPLVKSYSIGLNISF